MARKAVHLLAAAPRQTGRDAMWAAIRRHADAGRGFSARDLWREVDAQKATAKSFVKALFNGGFLKKGAGRFTPFDQPYLLIRDVGVEAPRVRPDGSLVTQGSGRENLWRTIKVLAQFTARDLAIHAEVPLGEVKSYLKFLGKAGYIVAADRGVGGAPTTWRFIRARNTGPKPPMIQRVLQVFDPNLGRVVWPAPAEGDAFAPPSRMAPKPRQREGRRP